MCSGKMEIIFEASQVGSQLRGFMENSISACWSRLLKVFVSRLLL